MKLMTMVVVQRADRWNAMDGMKNMVHAKQAESLMTSTMSAQRCVQLHP